MLKWIKLYWNYYWNWASFYLRWKNSEIASYLLELFSTKPFNRRKIQEKRRVFACQCLERRYEGTPRVSNRYSAGTRCLYSCGWLHWTFHIIFPYFSNFCICLPHLKRMNWPRKFHTTYAMYKMVISTFKDVSGFCRGSIYLYAGINLEHLSVSSV